jgi:hypothetical protein
LIERTIVLVRAAAATCLILFLVGWSDALQKSYKSFSGVLVLGLVASVYLWLTSSDKDVEKKRSVFVSAS